MRIKSQTTFVAAMLLFLGIVMLAMPIGMIYGFSADGPVPGGVWMIAALFGAIGLLLAYVSTKRLVQRVSFGRWEVECPDGGGYLGQPLEVKLLPPQLVTPTGELECSLVCIHSTGVRRTAQGTGTTRGTATRFSRSWSFRPATIQPQVGVPITLPLPEFGLGSARGRKVSVQWKLSVTVPCDRTTHEMEFEIPVNDIGARPQDAAVSIEEEAERRERAAEYQQASQARPGNTPAP